MAGNMEGGLRMVREDRKVSTRVSFPAASYRGKGERWPNVDAGEVNDHNSSYNYDE